MKKLIRDACEMVRKAGPVVVRRAGCVAVLSATVAMSSCITDPEGETCTGDGKKIVFREVKATDGIAVTRAMEKHPIENVPGTPHAGEIPTGKSFGVFAWTHSPVTPHPEFEQADNAIVTYNGSNNYAYSGGGTWPSNKQMSFMAYYPHTGSADAILNGGLSAPVISGQSMEIDYIVPTDGGKHIDLMYAYRPANAYGEVDLTFRHALSRMKFSTRIAGFDPGVEVKVTGITVKNAVLSGTLTVNNNDTKEDPLFVKPSWSLDTGVTGDITVSDTQLSDVTLGDVAEFVITQASDPTGSGDLIVLPQESTDLELEITATQDGKEFSYLLPLVAAPALEMNNIYHYVVTLTSQEATFDVLVLPWSAHESDYITDGQYRLEVHERELFFPSTSAPEFDVEIFTDYPTGWTIENINYLDSQTGWLSNPTLSSSGGDGSTILPVTVADNTSSSRRRATFDVVARNMHMKVTVYQEPAASYIAPPGVLGVGARTGKLTLRGSKEYQGTDIEWQSEFGPLADESVYVAYFRRGSLLAWGFNEGISASSIIWAPAGYVGEGVTEEESLAAFRSRAAATSSIRIWSNLTNYVSADSPWPGNSLIDGLGDPCTFADDGNGSAPWKVPTQVEMNAYIYTTDPQYYMRMFTLSGAWSIVTGSINNARDMFLPYASSRGRMSLVFVYNVGYYQTRDGYSLLVSTMTPEGEYINNTMSQDSAISIRCVPAP